METNAHLSAWRRLCVQGLAVLLSGAALSAQEPLAAWKPAPLPTAPRIEPAPSTLAVLPRGLAPAPYLELGYVAPPAPPVLSRAALDAPADAVHAPGFEELPGGIVFGRVARLSPELSGAHLAFEGERLALRTGERAFLLPAAPAGRLLACLAFARRALASDVAVDIGGDGTVLLAPELVDTEAGYLLIAADRAPHALAPGHPLTKSVIVDREVRVTADPFSGQALLAADLEVRFYRPGSDWLEGGAADCTARRAIPAGDASDALARELSTGAELAAWIGLFRQALAADPEGVRAVELSLAAAAGAPVLTPRQVPPLGRDAAREPAPVQDWMRAYRARAETR